MSLYTNLIDLLIKYNIVKSLFGLLIIQEDRFLFEIKFIL